MLGENEVFWIAQGIGGIGLVLTFFTFQKKTRKEILSWQIMSAVVYGVHYLLLGALTGAAVSAYVAIRDLVFEEKSSRPWARHKIWLYAFMSILGLILFVSWEGPISLLPVSASMLATYALWQNSSERIRFYMSGAASLGLFYAVSVDSYAGIVAEIVLLVSINVTMHRLMKKKKHHTIAAVHHMRRHIRH